MPAITDPNVLVGTATADDAAVYRVSDNLAVIETLDFFTPIVDAPYMFGAIAAANSLSDVYAMGGKPVLALNIVAFPRDSEETPIQVLNEILKGGSDKAAEAGISIVGGHTIDDPGPKYGLSVTGLVHPDRVWRNTGAKPGDRLILTKPLGIGIITTALQAGAAKEKWTRSAVEHMAELNREASEIAAEVGVRACTDITGFGFLGHLHEMLGDGGLGARVFASTVPVLEGAGELALAGHVPAGSRRNRESLMDRVLFHTRVAEEDHLVLCDAQTSGGLLFAVEESKANALVFGLRAAGVLAAEVGEFFDSKAAVIEVLP